MPFVRDVMAQARERLVVARDRDTLADVARRLHADTDMIVLSDAAGALAGIVTKTDVVARLVDGGSLHSGTAIVAVMRREVVACREADTLEEVWSLMRRRRLKNVPVVDDEGRPRGLLNARDLLQHLLREVENEEEMLRDYVMGVGYR